MRAHATFKAVAVLALLLAAGASSTPAASPVDAGEEMAGWVEDYVDQYFRFYPTRAVMAGRFEHSPELEDFAPERRERWLRFNEAIERPVAELMAEPSLPDADRLDGELLLRQIRTEIFELRRQRRPRRDPLYWSQPMANAVVHLLLRDDRPEPLRLRRACKRAETLPRLVEQARKALEGGDPTEIPAFHVRAASRQAAATAEFYRSGFPQLAEGQDERHAKWIEESAAAAAPALQGFAEFLDGLAEEASGSPRLGSDYADRFHLVTGVEEEVDSLLERAEADLEAKRSEAAEFGRSVWGDLFPDRPAPEEDRRLLRELFDRIAEDRAESAEEFVADFEGLVDESIRFVRERGIVTLPDPLTLYVGPSPSYFTGRTVGGVYPAGPWAPEADTLFLLPMHREDADEEERRAFFRDFNDHFNTMIVPHEIVPGHYLQLKFAARHPRKVRALFADGVYVEGWGTFCERLMLDRGWGGPLDRVAHLKKQLENIARTVVDIRVHTRGLERDEVLDFVREEAIQEDQFARNMWARALTTSPQLTSYYLGFDRVRALFEDVRAARGEEFELREFMDGMMELGPVPVERYRDRMLGGAGGDAAGGGAR